MKDLLKIAALVAGGWFVFSSEWFRKLTGAPAPVAAAEPGPMPVTEAGPAPGPQLVSVAPAAPAPIVIPTPAAAPPQGYSAAELNNLTKRAAMGDVAAVAITDSRNIKYTADEWNFFRAEGGGGTTTQDLFPEGDRGYKMLASEYLRRRLQAGLSGLLGFRLG